MPEKEQNGSPHLGRGTWVAFGLIYLATVPWYLPRDWIDPTLWAFPAWSLVMVAGATVLAAFNAYVFLRLWPGERKKP